MRVVLFRPHTPGGVAVPPISLGYLAAALRCQHQVFLRDGLRGPEETWDPGFPPGAVCVSVTSADLLAVQRLAGELRQRYPATLLVLGGPHPSTVGETVLREVPEADFAFMGEVEGVLPGFLEELASGVPPPPRLADVPGLVWREGPALRANPTPVPPDLEYLTVAWDLMPPEQYSRELRQGRRAYRPVAPLVTSRGCPDACTFCEGSTVSGRTLRRRSLGSLVEEIRLLVRHYGVRGIEIMDDNFTADRVYVRAFCGAVSSNFPGLVWACPNGVRLEALDAQTAGEMARSGCVAVSVGVDPCLNRARRTRRLPEALDFISDRIRLLSGAGIAVDWYALLRLPGESPEEAALKSAAVKRLPVRTATFSFYRDLSSFGQAPSPRP